MSSSGQSFETLSALAGRLAGLAPDDANGHTQARAALDAEYWRLLQQIAHEACTDPLPHAFSVSDEALGLIDFGLLPGVINPASPNTQAVRQAVAASPSQMALFSDSLAGAWQDCLRFELVQRLRVQLEAIERDLKEWPELHLAMIRHRDQLVLDALGDSPQAQHVLRLYSEIDERLEQYKRYERLSQQAAFRSNDERKQWLSIKGYVDERRQQAEPLLAPLSQRAREVRAALQEVELEISGRHADLRAAETDSRRAQEAILAAYATGATGEALAELQRELAKVVFYIERTQGRIVDAQARAAALLSQHFPALASEQLDSASEMVFDSVGRLLELHGNRQDLEQKMLEEQRALAQVTATEMRTTLHAEIANVRGLLRLAARYAHVQECAVDAPPGLPVEPAQVDLALTHIEHFDPRLFRNEHARRHGRPTVLLAPGVGEGVYDRDRNRFVIPQRSGHGAESSLANACALYRLEIDAAADDNALAGAYRKQARRTAKLRSNLKLRNKLAEDYQLWITQEAHGNPVLSREIRQWFEDNIAPPKEDPWVPPEYLDLSQRQLGGRLNELERAAQSADREYRCGILYWLLYPGDARAIRDWALPRLERAIQLDPTRHGLLYSAAALHKKVQSFQRAIDLFNQFARQAPQSWWTRKATELCAICR